MYFLLILFFGSLLGITFMIGRKFLIIQSGQIVHREDFLLEIPFLKEAKHLTIKNIKILGRALLIEIIRFYFRSTNFLKSKYQKIKIKIKNIYRKNQNNHPQERQEISKFLKIISEYKEKIREIKHKIKEEEKGL